MKRIAWLSDIHVDVLERMRRANLFDALLDKLWDESVDAVVITGDIGEAHNVVSVLTQIENRLQCPIYFVLGNHDYYRSSIKDVRASMTTLSTRSPWLRWLNTAGVVELTPTTCLVGHDGWADGRYGDYDRSSVELYDYYLIWELSNLEKMQRLVRLNRLGDEAADHFRSVLPAALERYPHVIAAMHPPPFREACWHKGKLSDDDAMPHFSCKAVGDVLREFMQAHPHRQMTVLCGHTHGECEVQMLDNLTVYVSGTEYGRPRIERMLEFQE